MSTIAAGAEMPPSIAEFKRPSWAAHYERAGSTGTVPRLRGNACRVRPEAADDRQLLDADCHGVLTTRNPKLSRRLCGPTLPRKAERPLFGLSLQEPPRRTRAAPEVGPIGSSTGEPA